MARDKIDGHYTNITLAELIDIPDDYAGHIGETFVINSSANGLVFSGYTPSSVENFTDLIDTPSSYSGQEGKILKINTSANGVTFSDNFFSVNIFTSTGTTSTGDQVIFCNSSTGVNLFLHTAVGFKGKELRIKNIDTGTITITPEGSEKIDGNSTLPLATGESVILISNGGDWFNLLA